jgi:hypothetical protein
MIVFHQLERNDLVKIVDLEVAKVIERVRAKDIKVHLDTTAVEFLIDKGYDPIYGARPMRRAVEKYLEDPLAEGFLRGNIKQGDTLEVHAAGEQLAFKVTVAGAKRIGKRESAKKSGVMQQYAAAKGAIAERSTPRRPCCRSGGACFNEDWEDTFRGWYLACDGSHDHPGPSSLGPSGPVQ